MVLCRFFQQGFCRYGNNCRFEHQGNSRQIFPSNQYGGGNYNNPNNNQNQSSYNVSTNNRFGTFGNNDNRGGGGGGKQFAQSSGGGATFNDFVNSVIIELESSIKGNQWPFSCFAPQKDGDNWPGLEDMSQEELRLEAYQCQQQGRMNTYIQGVDQLKNVHAAKNNEIKSRSPAVMDLLRKCFQLQKIENKSFSAPFGQQPSSGNNVGSTVPFTFSVPQFGSGSSQQVTVLPFGQSNAAAPPPPPSYGQATASSWPTSQPFAPSHSLIQPANVFGSNTNTNSLQSQPFGQPPQQQQSVFGTPPQPFGVVNTNTSFQVQNTPQPTGMISAPQPQMIANVITNDQTLEGIHTPMDELNDDEKEQFMAASFAIGRIPIRPPPKELC